MSKYSNTNEETCLVRDISVPSIPPLLRYNKPIVGNTEWGLQTNGVPVPVVMSILVRYSEENAFVQYI